MVNVINAPDDCRQHLLTTIDHASKLAYQLAPHDELVHRGLREAQRLALESHLNLVILGGEGHGKSTLINSIIGQDLAPTSRDNPGTVAPIIVELGPSSRPEFQVAFQDQDGDVACRSSEEFGGYLLQKHNPDNLRHVRHGLIRIDHDLLRHGLRLIDMPGMAGVSGKVAEETAAFVRGEVNVALAVVRNRGYAPILRLLETLPADGLAIEAVICNRDGDFWDEFDTEAALRRGMHDQRVALVEELVTDSFKIDPKSVFVLHLPSMRGLRPAKSRGPTGQAHDKEIGRFSAWFRDYLKGVQVRTRLTAATNLAHRTIAHVAARNDERGQLVSALLDLKQA
jgi:Dynamin family